MLDPDRDIDLLRRNYKKSMSLDDCHIIGEHTLGAAEIYSLVRTREGRATSKGIMKAR